MLPIDQVGELLSLVADDKKISFDREYAESLYRRYNEQKSVDDTAVVTELKRSFKGKDILLIAPGKSLLKYEKQIHSMIDSGNYITIGLNNFAAFSVDYILTTRRAAYDMAVNGTVNTIVTSNVSKGGRGNVMVLNYDKWICVDESTHDSSGIIALNLLTACNVHKICMAGFDGYTLGYQRELL